MPGFCDAQPRYFSMEATLTNISIPEIDKGIKTKRYITDKKAYLQQFTSCEKLFAILGFFLGATLGIYSAINNDDFQITVVLLPLYQSRAIRLFNVCMAISAGANAGFNAGMTVESYRKLFRTHRHETPFLSPASTVRLRLENLTNKELGQMFSALLGLSLYIFFLSTLHSQLPESFKVNDLSKTPPDGLNKGFAIYLAVIYCLVIPGVFANLLGHMGNCFDYMFGNRTPINLFFYMKDLFCCKKTAETEEVPTIVVTVPSVPSVITISTEPATNQTVVSVENTDTARSTFNVSRESEVSVSII